MIYSINTHKWVSPDDKFTANFTYGELVDPIEPVVYMNMMFMRDMVEPLRVSLGVPFRVNSACRSETTNQRVKGHPRSLHLMFNKHHKYLGTLALDISSVGWDVSTKKEFIKLAYKMGLSVGSHENFYHIDGRVLCGLNQATFKY